MKTVLLTAAATLTLAFSTPCLAETRGHPDMSRAVSLADLDMGSKAGAQVALRRLTRAAQQVCGDRSDRAEIVVRGYRRECTSTKLARAIEVLGVPTVTALYERQRGVQPVRFAAR